MPQYYSIYARHAISVSIGQVKTMYYLLDTGNTKTKNVEEEE